MEKYIPNRKVLYVDDEASLLSSFVSLMRKQNVQTQVLNDSRTIDSVLNESGPFAVVLSDQRMPEVDGVEVLERVSRAYPDTVRVMVTGYADHGDTLRAINQGGISRYVAKPWNDDELRSLVDEFIQQYNLKKENQVLLEELDHENAKLTELLDGTVAGTARILGEMIGYVNPEAASQVDRVRRLGNAILNTLTDVPPTERWEISRALDLFNLGLAVLPPSIQLAINKEGLSAVGRSPVGRNHHLLAAGLLKSIPRFAGVARIIELHHKDFDGNGEPIEDLTKESELPLGARLLHILVDLDTSTRANILAKTILNRMAIQQSKYDVTLVRNMLGDAAPTSTFLERTITVKKLQPGMRLIDDIVTESGQLLLRAEATLSETTINILRQWHVKDPIVEPIRVHDSL